MDVILMETFVGKHLVEFKH